MSIRFILTLFLLIAFNKTNAATFLETIEDESLVCLYGICESLDKISDTKFLLIQKADSTQKKYSIFELKQQIRLIVSKDLLLKRKPIGLFTTSDEDGEQIKAKIINAPKVFFYSEISGKSILKFECKSVILFRKKVGPFEIPYKTHIIKDPLVQLL